MSNVEIELTTNANEVFAKFQRLTIKEMEKALKSGLRAGLRSLQKQAKSNLRKDVKNVNKRNPKFNDTLSQGVRVTKIKTDKDGNIVGYVSITSSKKHNSGSYRLVFFEGGTKPRYAKSYNGNRLKKRAYRGKITATHFFSNAQKQIKNQFDKIMLANVNKAIDKINSKK